MQEKELLDEIRNVLINSDQETMFGSTSDEKLDGLLSNFLRFRGHRVEPPKVFEVNIKSSDDLIKYFYALHSFHFPKNYTISSNIIKDRSIAKKFINSRMGSTGANKSYVLNECGCIIKTIFNNINEFNFSYALNFSILGQGNLKWVTDKAIDIMNKELLKKEDEEGDIRADIVISKQDTSDLGFEDISGIAKRLRGKDNAEKEDN